MLEHIGGIRSRGNGCNQARGLFRILLRGNLAAELRDESFQLLATLRIERSVEVTEWIFRGDAHHGGFEPWIFEVWIRLDQGAAHVVRTDGARRENRFEPHALVGILEPLEQRGGQVALRSLGPFGGDAQRGLLHRRVAIDRDGLTQRRVIELAGAMENPEGRHLRLVVPTEGKRRQQRLERVGRLGIILLDQQPRGHETRRVVRNLQRLHQFGSAGLRQIRHRHLLRLLVIHAPDAAKVMIAIRTQRGVRRAVNGAARVVVDDGLIVEIHDVERAIRPDARVDGTEPFVASADELRFARLVRLEGDAVRLDDLMMDDVDGRLRGEVAVIPLLRPGAAAVNRAARRRREEAHQIDLHVGLLIVGNQRKGLLSANDRLVARGAGDLAPREFALGHDDVVQQITARRLRVEQLVVRRDLHAPGVAALRGHLLDHRAVRLEANDPRADAAEVLRLVAIEHMRARAVAVRRINPSVVTPADVVDDRVRVADAEAGVKLLDLVRLAVAVRVAQTQDVRRLGNDHAVLVEHEAGDEFEAFVENFLLVHAPVAIRVGENGDAINGRTLRVRRTDAEAGILPRRTLHLGFGLTAAVRIFRRLGDPQAAIRSPLDVHHLVDERLGGHEGDVEIGVNIELGCGFLRRGRAALGITQRGQFFLRAKLIHIRALPRPGDAAQHHGFDVRQVKGLVVVPEQGDERAMILRLVGPHLRLHVIDRGLPARPDVGAVERVIGPGRRVAGGEDARLRHHVQVVVNLVVHLEVRHALRDRMLRVHVVEIILALVPL